MLSLVSCVCLEALVLFFEFFCCCWVWGVFLSLVWVFLGFFELELGVFGGEGVFELCFFLKGGSVVAC